MLDQEDRHFERLWLKMRPAVRLDDLKPTVSDTGPYESSAGSAGSQESMIN